MLNKYEYAEYRQYLLQQRRDLEPDFDAYVSRINHTEAVLFEAKQNLNAYVDHINSLPSFWAYGNHMLMDEHNRVCVNKMQFIYDDPNCMKTITDMAHLENRISWFTRLGTDVYRPEFCAISNKSADRFEHDFNPLVLHHRITTYGQLLIESIIKHVNYGSKIHQALSLAAVDVSMRLLSMYNDNSRYIQGETGNLNVLLFKTAMHVKMAGEWWAFLGIDVYYPPAFPERLAINVQEMTASANRCMDMCRVVKRKLEGTYAWSPN